MIEPLKPLDKIGSLQNLIYDVLPVSIVAPSALLKPSVRETTNQGNAKTSNGQPNFASNLC